MGLEMEIHLSHFSHFKTSINQSINSKDHTDLEGTLIFSDLRFVSDWYILTSV